MNIRGNKVITHIAGMSKKIKTKENVFLALLTLISISLSYLVYYEVKGSKICGLDETNNHIVSVSDITPLDQDNEQPQIRPYVPLVDGEEQARAGALNRKKLYDWEDKNFLYIIADRHTVKIDKKLPFAFPSMEGETSEVFRLGVNDRFFKHFLINNVDEGRLFEKEDYILQNKNIPVLLGSKYRGYFKLNDILPIHPAESCDGYIENKYEVIGFLPEGSSYANDVMVHSLDDKVIIPSFEAISDEVEFKEEKPSYGISKGMSKEFVKAIYEWDLYTKKICGCIITDEPSSLRLLKSLQDMFNKKCQEISPEIQCSLYESNGTINAFWGLNSQEILRYLPIFSMIVVIIVMVCLSINMAVKILSMKKFYAIYMANGASKKKIYMSIIYEIFTLNIIPLLLSIPLFIIYLYCITRFYMPTATFGLVWKTAIEYMVLWKEYKMLIIFYLIINTISIIYPCLVFKRLNIAKTLQGDN